MSKIKKQELKKLRNKLPHRYANELSKRTGAKPGLIWNVMNGLKPDYHGIIKAAAEWAKELEKEREEIRDILNNNNQLTKS
jgi:hypothetical protein